MKLIASMLALLALPAWAGADFACIQNCSRQGYDQSQCITICQSNQGGPGMMQQPRMMQQPGMLPQQPGMMQQPGVPRNPYLDALPDPVPKSKPVQTFDPRCLDDCTRRGYKYQLCRKQCSY